MAAGNVNLNRNQNRGKKHITILNADRKCTKCKMRSTASLVCHLLWFAPEWSLTCKVFLHSNKTKGLAGESCSARWKWWNQESDILFYSKILNQCWALANSKISKSCSTLLYITLERWSQIQLLWHVLWRVVWWLSCRQSLCSKRTILITCLPHVMLWRLSFIYFFIWFLSVC